MEPIKQNKYVGQFIEVVIEDLDNFTGRKRGIVKRGFLVSMDNLVLYLKEKDGTMGYPWSRILKIRPPEEIGDLK